MASTLIDADGFKDRFDIDEAIDKKRVELHIRTASFRLRQWVSDAVYLEALTTAAEEETPGEEPILLSDADQRLNDLMNAEAHLTFHYALLAMNSPLGPKGVLKIAKVEGNASDQYLSPVEMSQLSTQFLDLAREICEPYLSNDGTPASPFETVPYEC